MFDDKRKDGPAWLGIGAQRSGTTWFTDLLLQHPQVTLSKKGLKELHLLYPSLERPVDAEAYRSLFPSDGCPGEWTPYYMRAAGCAETAAALCRSNAPILVLLRDPIDRFVSAMRFYEQRRYVAGIGDRTRTRLLMGDAVWAGMYATQLADWEHHFSRKRLIVLQYEAVRASFADAVTAIWKRLGLDPIPVRPAPEPAPDRNTSRWAPSAQMREALQRSYRGEVQKMRTKWGFDVSLWSNFVWTLCFFADVF